LIHNTLDNIKKFIQQGEISKALIDCQQFCSNNPTNLQAWFILTDLYLRSKQSSNALNAILKAENLAPTQPQIRILKINCLALTGNTKDALVVAKKLFNEQPLLLAKDWSSLGLHFHQLNSLSLAHQCFESAVKIEPNNSHYQFNYATSLRNNGDLEGSARALNKVISLKPNDWDAYLARSLLKKVTQEQNNITDLIALTNNPKTNKEAQSKLFFALAKEEEDCQQYKNSIKHLQQANEIRSQFTQYNVDNDIETIDSICTNFGEFGDIHLINKPNNSNQPIFIIGLPRTGTTLLERIISQHPDVLAAGELHDFSTCLTLTVNSSSSTPLNNKQEFIKQSARIDFNALGETYLNSTKELVQDNPFFIDKMPLNFLYTGLIQRALPQAKIIHLTRAPMAACYAIYKTSFGQAYPFSYNLDNLAKYYIAYRKLMDHWLKSNDNNFVEVSYESLVKFPQETSEQVFRFLSLPWQTEYLTLKNNKQASATASSSQVRGKIYQSSVELWRKYAKELSPLREELLQAGIEPDNW